MFDKEARIATLEWTVKTLKRDRDEERESRRTLREDFTALLDTLGLEVKHGNPIVKKLVK